ncbi:MAG TPA: primosomal protein N' [Acidobacteria bacterium]|nr:primosomal protein N' [Acidobacteriota bacterium]HAK55329.1 primosomal protein N' [Acidobacteriota bacterium]
MAVPVPLRDLLTYRVPDGWAVPAPGARVVVPLGPRRLVGCVVASAEAAAAPDPRTLKDLDQVLDESALVPPSVMALALWAAEYYLCGPGQTIEAALPAGRTAGFRTVRRFEISESGRAALEGAGGSRQARRLGRRQVTALGALAAASRGLDQAALVELGVPTATLRRLEALDLVRVSRRQVSRISAVPLSGSPRREVTLTAEQAAAVDRLTTTLSERRFGVALLHGVTGSGKTEVYLRLALETQRAGRRVLVLVPEIGLTPASVTAFRAVFGERVAIQHSGLSPGERHDQWHRIRSGDVDVVVGTRSAVFAPLDDLGLVIVDEEHDASYKQEETPRYHGRDLAVVRGQHESALVVLGSATPSLESYQQALRGRYDLVRLATRVTGHGLSAVRIVDMKVELAECAEVTALSRALAEGIEDRLARREQAIVLLNRRGYAPVVFCRQCEASAECPNCSVSLTAHRGHGRVRCHYCGYARALPTRCPSCSGEFLELAGVGTERLEAEVRQRCPGARVARMDRDTMARRGAAAALLAEFGRGDIDVLVGTQMIAKGHDFPRVTLVGVVAADGGLGIGDFRAAERTFQLLTQVAGRAGRGERPGETIVQTLYPDHYSIRHACRQDYEGFYQEEIAFRQAMRYPPSLALVNLVVRGRTEGEAMRDGAVLARALRDRTRSGWVLGPAPAALGRLKGEHRVQILAKGDHRVRLRSAVESTLADHPRLVRRVTVDVDPVSVR